MKEWRVFRVVVVIILIAIAVILAIPKLPAANTKMTIPAGVREV